MGSTHTKIKNNIKNQIYIVFCSRYMRWVIGKHEFVVMDVQQRLNIVGNWQIINI